MLQYLSDYEKGVLTKVSAQLEKEIPQVQQFNTSPEFAECEQKLQKNIERLQTEIKERKHKKYIRDRRDFETGQIYTGRNTSYSNTNRRNRYTNSQVSNTDISESDISGSEESVSKSYNNKSAAVKRKNRYRAPTQQRRAPAPQQQLQSTTAHQTWTNTSGYIEQNRALEPVKYKQTPVVTSMGLGNIPTPSMSCTSSFFSGPPQSSLDMGASAGNPQPSFLAPGVTLRDRDKWVYNTQN